MVDDEPDLNLLVALRALLEESNVTRAGERIGIGQSTMSSALSRLRVVFRDELLVRVGRDYDLTPLARQLLPQVQLTLPLVAMALGQTERFDPTTAKRRFTMEMTDYAAIELGPLLSLASATAPGISVELAKLDVMPAEANRHLLARDFVVAPPAIVTVAPSRPSLDFVTSTVPPLTARSPSAWMPSSPAEIVTDPPSTRT